MYDNSGPPRESRRKRIPQLRFTDTRGLGWHVTYRDPATKTPRKHPFGVRERGRESEAKAAYHAWLAKWLSGEVEKDAIERTQSKAPKPTKKGQGILAEVADGSIAAVVSDYITRKVDGRARPDAHTTERKRGSIDPRVAVDRRKQLKDFVAFLNERYGPKACNRLRVSELTLGDIEAYNQWLVEDANKGKGYSHTQVVKRLQIVRNITDWAGRPEHGTQGLAFRWEAVDRVAGEPAKGKVLPTVKQLKRLLETTDLRGQLWIWLGIGCGFGATDLAAIHVGQIDEESYDLRRSKTGIERFGSTPPLVWAYLKAFLSVHAREPGSLLFTTDTDPPRPLSHRHRTEFYVWWRDLREAIGESKDTLNGFYTLRHLGATEFGSRPRASLSEVKRWLGHGASSRMADVYLKPISPEYREVVEWLREQLQLDAVTIQRGLPIVQAFPVTQGRASKDG